MTTIVAQGAEDPLLRINHTGHAGNPALRFEQDADDKAYVWWDSAHNLLNLGTPTTNPILSLQNNGRVGIGTLTPYVKLQVAGGGVATDSFFAFSHVQSVAPPWGVYISAPRDDTLGLFTRGQERVTINEDGKVTIGTTSPAFARAKLNAYATDENLPVLDAPPAFCARADGALNSAGEFYQGNQLAPSSTHALTATC